MQQKVSTAFLECAVPCKQIFRATSLFKESFFFCLCKIRLNRSTSLHREQRHVVPVYLVPTESYLPTQGKVVLQLRENVRVGVTSLSITKGVVVISLLVSNLQVWS